jgi:hypothetical protein
MGRKEERIRRRLEGNPVAELNKVQNKFYPELFQKFSETHDPRHQGYVVYANRIMLGTIYYKGVSGIVSMQGMNYEFNDPLVARNLTSFMGMPEMDYVPHYVTENEYLGKLNPDEIQEIQQDIIYQMIRGKHFYDARFMNKWLVIVDATEKYSGRVKINENCLERHYNKGCENEKVNYYESVLEAKIYFGDCLIASIASEFIENNGEDRKRQESMSAEEIKQDCETKSFIRLSAKLKKKFPRLPIILLADSLYASKTVMGICASYNWDYIIRFKDGSIPSIAEEYESIPEKESAGHAEFINDIDYEGHKVNVLRFYEDSVSGGVTVRTNFQWLTNIRITKRNAGKLGMAGRRRWKIENEGFNRQKNWQNDITHACSHNSVAQKIHYLLGQISDFMKQLYEYYCLKKLGIRKPQKNISSELLKSFAWHLTAEDISTHAETQSVTGY